MPESTTTTAIPTRQQTLATLTNRLLTPDTDLLQIKKTLDALRDLLAEVTGLDPDREVPAEARQGIQLPSGLALSPIDSARCLLDPIRTTQYVRGMYFGLRALQERFPGQTLQVVYAGTGPYAPFFLPLITQFHPDEVQFTLIEINPLAAVAVERLIDAFEAARYVRAVLQTDATAYTHRGPVHLVVVEAMQRALTKEPQVAIAMNLAPQLVQGGLMIPQEVTVSARIIDPHQAFNTLLPQGATQPTAPAQFDLGDVFTLNVKTARRATPRHHGGLQTLRANTLRAPVLPRRGYQLMFFTHIHVFGDITIEPFQSGLTHPAAMMQFPVFDGGDRLVIHYLLGLHPDWHCDVLR